MYKVYWTDKGTPSAIEFDSDEMCEALKMCESLRTRRSNGEEISFITMASESIPGNTTKEGVAEPSLDYAWKKRRI